MVASGGLMRWPGTWAALGTPTNTKNVPAAPTMRPMMMPIMIFPIMLPRRRRHGIGRRLALFHDLSDKHRNGIENKIYLRSNLGRLYLLQIGRYREKLR